MWKSNKENGLLSDRVTNLNCCFVIFFHWRIFQKEIQKYSERYPKKSGRNCLCLTDGEAPQVTKLNWCFAIFGPWQMVVFSLDYPTTPVFTHIIWSSNSSFPHSFGSCQKINSQKHPKLWKAHRRTFFDVLIPSCLFPKYKGH